ncbi:RBD2 [Candida pseudojiufengensis]|uniref:RBD2 n=1 Tax=Candida pseudojiufengensis TaxID=497109 RepID=UPI0022241D0A|nr:RBD2 [Candida pseudojiufengensis]KAI5959773.1 RBD2 [Candida pseudojiufengensis]
MDGSNTTPIRFPSTSETSPFNKFPPSYETLKQTPAFTAGFTIFTLILCILKNTYNVNMDSLILYPRSPLDFNLNAISFYSLIHVSYLHWLLNIMALFTPLAMFEKRHGTIYTGITLNLLTVIAALQYCIVGLWLYPETGVLGLSGIVFSFMSFMAYHEYQYKPILTTIQLGGYDIKIYTLSIPFLAALIFFIIFPSSSLPGHIFGITTGYLLAYGLISKLYPPSHILSKIEKTLEKGISKLEPLVTYFKEDDAVTIRGVTYIPLLSEEDIEVGSGRTRGTSTSIAGGLQPPQATRSASYVRESRVLGEA